MRLVLLGAGAFGILPFLPLLQEQNDPMGRPATRTKGKGSFRVTENPDKIRFYPS